MMSLDKFGRRSAGSSGNIIGLVQLKHKLVSLDTIIRQSTDTLRMIDSKIKDLEKFISRHPPTEHMATKNYVDGVISRMRSDFKLAERAVDREEILNEESMEQTQMTTNEMKKLT